MDGLEGRGDGEDVVLGPDCVGGEGALVEVGGAVEGALGAEGVHPAEAVAAVVTGIVVVSPAYAVVSVLGWSRADDEKER